MAKRFGIVLGMAAAGVMALGALLPATASADDIIWSREDGTNSIRAGNLLGGGASTLFDDGGRPCGIAADPAAGKVYWATWDGGEIRVANLDGTGASTLFGPTGNNLCGVAVNPTAGKIYWANFTTNEIRAGNLDGTGASTLFTDPGGSAPSGVAIDPANNKIYWTNQFSDQVRAGNLDGSGTAQTLFGGEDNPIGVAADPAAGKIYWTDLNSGTVRVGPLGGSTFGDAQTLFNSTTPSGPAIDPTTNKIYWTSWQSGAGIRVGNLDGTGTPSTLFNGESASLFAALVKAPVNTGLPSISGGVEVGSELTCQNGTWAPDLLASFLFRAPASFTYQWQTNGSPDIIATSPTFTPNLPGDYTCTVTATNQAGSTSQTSSVFNVVDTTAPSLTVPGNITETATSANGNPIVFTGLSASDIVDANPTIACLDTSNGDAAVQSGDTFLGTHVISCTATDASLNTSPAQTFTISVTFDFHGYFQPVDNLIRNGMKSGSTAPIKFQIGNGNGGYISALGVVASTSSVREACSAGTMDDPLENYATGGTSLRYDTTAQQYIYNWQSPKGKAGSCYQVTIALTDGSAHSADFLLK